MASKTKDKEIIDEAKKLTKNLLELIGVEAKVAAVGEEDLVRVDIDGDDLGLLIGYRGENLESLQLVLGIILNKKLNLDPWRPVLLDVGGWREQREEALRNLIAKEIQKLSTRLNNFLEKKAGVFPAVFLFTPAAAAGPGFPREPPSQKITSLPFFIIS